MQKQQNKPSVFFLINSMENGGAERVLSNILPELAKKYNIHLILLKNKIFYDLPPSLTITPLSNIQNNFLMPFLFPVYVTKLKKLTKKHRPIKIISFLELANFLNIITNKESVISFRMSLGFFKKGLLRKTYRLLINLLYPKAKLITVNSKENEHDILTKLRLQPTQVKTIYNPVQIKLHDAVNIKLPFNKKPFTKIFISVGRLDKQKNFTTLIKAFATAPSDYALIIIGGGEEKENLEALIKDLSLQKRIFLLGHKKNVFDYLSIANYFIFASEAEGFPNALIEAMACKLPIITSDFKTGAREVIDPNLVFDKKIKYPHYGPNGALLSLQNFKNDFTKLDLKKVKQEQQGIKKFELNTIIKKWEKIINN